MKVKFIFLFLGLLTCLLMSFDKDKPRKVILVIFAHPDDETSIGAMMARYARTHEIVYIVATDGRNGKKLLRTLPEDSIAKIRKRECECSCEKLGIKPAVQLGFPDGLGMRTNIMEFFKITKSIKEILKTKIAEVNPDLIITFGPEGDSGHGDHRIIGDITTEIILREGWAERYPLYYYGWTKKQAAKFGVEELNYIDEKYFNVSVSFDQEDENKYFESIRCYKSQYTHEELEDWIKTDQVDVSNILYFRKFSIAKGSSSEFTFSRDY